MAFDEAPADAAAAPLRTGWTTGACATAGARAAFEALVTGHFPDPVLIRLPRGGEAAFALACHERAGEQATAGVVKDAGDDPDVTHGALVLATVRRLPAGRGVLFRAGPGIGTVTLPGLALAVGEPAINPVPRRMIADALEEVAARCGTTPDAEVTVSIPDGERLARRTLNGRLGIVGGLSVLGTTGIVKPYSCSAWLHGIRQGVDVARAAGLGHVAGATGRTSEAAVLRHHGLPNGALIDMGDLVGGMLKYLRDHPVPRVTVAGGLAKIAKLGQGLLDVHSARGAVDLAALAAMAASCGAEAGLVERIGSANTGAEAFDLAAAAGLPLADAVAEAAWTTAARVLDQPAIGLDVVIFDRNGALRGRTAVRPAQLPASPRNRRS